MALQEEGTFDLPVIPPGTGSTSLLMDASGEKVGFIVRASKAGDIAAFHFPLGVVTTGQTLKGSFQDVNTANGEPDGTIDQSGTVAVGDGDDNVWKTVTMGANRTVAVGDYLGIVIEFDSTTGNLNILTANQLPNANIYSLLYTGAAWAKQGRAPIVVLEYSDGSFSELVGVNAGLISAENPSNATTPDEIGLIINLSGPVTAFGMQVMGRLTGDLDAVLYDSDGTTVLASGSVDANVTQSAGDTDIFIPFTTHPDLLKDTDYRLVIKPTTSTTSRIYVMTTDDATYWNQMSGGSKIHYTSRTDAGSWTNSTTKRINGALICSKIDDGVGGASGILTHPGMSGGMRG